MVDGGVKREMLQSGEAVTIDKISLENNHRIQTGTREFDRVLGEGMVQGSIILIGGEPGKGKSTLCLQVACELAEALIDPCKVLYVSGEETPKQIRERAERIMMDATQKEQLPPSKMFFMAETKLENIEKKVLEIDPDVLVIDSIQTMKCPGDAGAHMQQRDATEYLTRLTKARGLTTLIISHVNKEGDLAGPKAVEHLVDVVLSFDAERSSEIRMLRAMKNRYGDTTEVGIFRMTSEGLKSVDNPSEYLIRGKKGAPGSCIACVMLKPGDGGVGSRAMLMEVQALCMTYEGCKGNRNSQGYDQKRLQMILAVLAVHTPYADLLGSDVYLNITPRGFQVEDSSLDLPVALAIVSSRLASPIPPGIVAWGEMGLTGEIRPDDYGELNRKMAVATAMKFKEPLFSKRDAILSIADALEPLARALKAPGAATEKRLGELGVSKRIGA